MCSQARIAVGGFQHETNTFAPHQASLDEFLRADGWPALTQGEALFKVMAGLNIPLAGFMELAQTKHMPLPLLWCSAEPSAHVTHHAFETICDMFCEQLAGIPDLDGVYLDLHGAMVTEHYEDGEGELLARVRDIIGPDSPLVVSLDLHANITSAMIKHASAITVFRTYPHLDMAETGARAFTLMQRLLAGEKIYSGMRRIPFLIPLSGQCTDFEPCRSIYHAVADCEKIQAEILNADFAPGFPPADIAECGPTVLAYGTNQDAVDECLQSLQQLVIAAESEFRNDLFSADAAVRIAMSHSSGKPMVLADAQDNPGAGGTSDTTGLLKSLVNNHATGAVIAILYDPQVAQLAHQAGLRGIFQVELGGKSGYEGSPPYSGRFEVDALGDGRFVFTGDMYKDSHANLGPMACLRVLDHVCDVRVIVGSERMQCLDQAIFRHLGIEPAEQSILVVKSTVHFRADFDPIAEQTLVVASPGAHPCELVDLPYQNLRHGVRLEPLGPVHPKSDF